MKKIIFSALCALPLIVSLTSCGKKKDEPNQPSIPDAVTKTITINASKYESWQYFSFSKGEVVNVTDYKNDLNWDMALHRYDVRLNCGESGKGKGAAVFSGVNEMEKATKVPTEGWVTDAIGTITIKFSMGGGSHDSNHEQTGYNHLITGKKTERGDMSGGWLDYDLGNMPPSVRLSGKVFFVKCADGKIARIQFTDCKDKTGRKNGFISFTYDYNVSVK